jgi:hypothetical protein
VADADTGAADFDSENARLGTAVASFVNWTTVVRRELSTVTPPDSALEAELNAISQSASTITTHRVAAIKFRRDGDFEKVAREMAAAERALQVLDGRFRDVEARLGAAQNAAVAAQREAAYSVRHADFAIAALNLLLIVGLLLAHTTPLAASQSASDTTIIFTGPTGVVHSPVPSERTSTERQLIELESNEGLDEFPSESEMPSQRRAG